MKRIILLLLLTANLQVVIRHKSIEINTGSAALAQRMYREANDNCKINGYWYQVADLCDGDEQSSLRCEYCGLYFNSVQARTTHQARCPHRPHIEYRYDDAGNRLQRFIENYRLGKKVNAYIRSNCSRVGLDVSLAIACVVFTAGRKRKYGKKNWMD